MSDTPRTDEQINGKPCTRFMVCAGDSLRDALVPSEFARELERDNAKLRGKLFALEKAGDAMDLLLTGSMKPSKGVREAWAKAKKL